MVRIATLNVDIVSVPEPIMKPFKSMKFVCLRIFLMYDNPHNSQYFWIYALSKFYDVLDILISFLLIILGTSKDDND